MVDDHTKAGDELKSLASQKNVTLPTDVKAWAAKTLPTLQDHLKQAQNVSGHLGT